MWFTVVWSFVQQVDGAVQVSERTSLVPCLLVLSFTEKRVLDSPGVIMDYLFPPAVPTVFILRVLKYCY